MPVRRLKVAGVGMEKPKLLCYVFIPSSLPPSLYIHTPCNLQYSLGVCLEFLVHCICLECLASVVCPPSYQGQDCIPMLHGAGGVARGGEIGWGRGAGSNEGGLGYKQKDLWSQVYFLSTLRREPALNNNSFAEVDLACFYWKSFFGR